MLKRAVKTESFLQPVKLLSDFNLVTFNLKRIDFKVERLAVGNINRYVISFKKVTFRYAFDFREKFRADFGSAAGFLNETDNICVLVLAFFNRFKSNIFTLNADKGF